MTNEIVAAGIRTWQDLGLTITSDSKVTPPSPITHEVDVPGRPEGSLDLTEALTGGVSYSKREFDLVMAADYGDASARQRVSDALMNRWHGRRLSFECSWDPGYWYEGRFQLTSLKPAGPCGLRLELEVEADPFRVKRTEPLRLNAIGGHAYDVVSGRVPVRPTIQCPSPTLVVFEGRETRLGAGTWRLNDVLFRQGVNRIYINSYPIRTCLWGDLASGAAHATTWGAASAMRWDELGEVGWTGGALVRRSWGDLTGETWDGLAKSRWADLDKREGVVDSTVILSYDWKDL